MMRVHYRFNAPERDALHRALRGWRRRVNRYGFAATARLARAACAIMGHRRPMAHWVEVAVDAEARHVGVSARVAFYCTRCLQSQRSPSK